MVEAEWDGRSLTARGTSRAGRVALLGEDHADGEVTVPAERIASVGLREPALLGAVNGCLTVVTTDGRSFRLNYRRKSASEFRALAEAITPAG